MPNKVPRDLLLDSEESLRLADSLLSELREETDPTDTDTDSLSQRLDEERVSAVELPQILLRAYTEISNVLESLRRSRLILEHTTLERVQRTQEKLREVSSATEVATIDMLDDLDGALALLDRLDEAASEATADTATIRGQLRDRLHGLITRLQFQDITAQQLGYASSVLEDVERRMHAIAQLIDQNLVGLEHVTAEHDFHASHPETVDPGASTRNAQTRQAVADEIFLVR